MFRYTTTLITNGNYCGRVTSVASASHLSQGNIRIGGMIRSTVSSARKSRVLLARISFEFVERSRCVSARQEPPRRGTEPSYVRTCTCAKPRQPKSALGCAGELVSRFKMKIGSLSSRLVAERRRRRRRSLEPTTGQRLVEEEEALLVAPDVHIYHPLLLPGQTSGLTGRAQRPNPPPPPGRAPEELRFAGATRCLLSPRETRA